MSFNNRCLSNYFSNYNGTFKINNQSTKNGRNSMTPNRISNEENNDQSEKKSSKSFLKSTNESADNSKNINNNYKNKVSLNKTITNMQSSSNKRNSDNKKFTFKSTTSNNTGLPTNFMLKYKEEKLKTVSDSTNTDQNHQIQIKLDVNTNLTKNEYLLRNSMLNIHTKNKSFTNKFQDYRINKIISPMKTIKSRNTVAYNSNINQILSIDLRDDNQIDNLEPKEIESTPYIKEVIFNL